MHHRRSCIESQIHASRKIMHHELISRHRGKLCIASQYPCIAENHVSRVNIHASRKIMHRELISKHREKIFIPRKKLYIRRRFHASSKFVHREKISYLAEIYTHHENISCLVEGDHNSFFMLVKSFRNLSKKVPPPPQTVTRTVMRITNH